MLKQTIEKILEQYKKVQAIRKQIFCELNTAKIEYLKSSFVFGSDNNLTVIAHKRFEELYNKYTHVADTEAKIAMHLIKLQKIELNLLKEELK